MSTSTTASSVLSTEVQAPPALHATLVVPFVALLRTLKLTVWAVPSPARTTSWTNQLGIENEFDVHPAAAVGCPWAETRAAAEAARRNLGRLGDNMASRLFHVGDTRNKRPNREDAPTFIQAFPFRKMAEHSSAIYPTPC